MITLEELLKFHNYLKWPAAVANTRSSNKNNKFSSNHSSSNSNSSRRNEPCRTKDTVDVREVDVAIVVAYLCA